MSHRVFAFLSSCYVLRLGPCLGVLLLSAACSAENKRQELPPAAAKTSNPPAPSALPEPHATASAGPFKKSVALAELRRASCVVADGTTTLKADSCGSGSVLYGPYVQVPEGAKILATFELEGIKGTALISADVVGGGGTRLYASAGTFTLKPGERQTVEVGSEARAFEDSLETRLWSRADPGTVFRIIDAKIELSRK